MPTTLAFKPLIDLPEWRPIANAPAVSAAGTQLVAGLRNNSDRGAYVYLLVNATTLWQYDVEDDDWMQLASPALTGTFGAGAGAVMMPAQGPRGVLAAGNTTTERRSEHRSARRCRAEPTRQQGQLERLQDPHHRQ